MKLREIMLGGVRGLPVAVALLAAPSAKAASTLWYNGDYDNRDALLNTTGTYYNISGTATPYNSYVYDDFVVPVGQTWTINSVFSNNQLDFFSTPQTATWSIRQGISSGNGGTLIASGDNNATETTLTENPSYYYVAPEERISTTLSSPVVLSAGTYYLSVAPDSGGQYYGEEAFIETTSGLNAVGIPPGNNGNSYITNNYPSNNPGALSYAPTTTQEGSGNWDYSMGIIGTASIVPEPSSLALLGSVIGLASLRMRRLTRSVAI